MNTRWKKAAAFGLCACLALSALSGCSKDDGFDAQATAITINEDTVPAGVVKFATHYMQAQYETMYASFGYTGIINQDIYGNGTTLGESLKDQMVEELTHLVLAEQHMEEYGVALSDGQKQEISEAASAFIAENDEEVLEKIGADQETVERYLELQTIQVMMQEAMGADVDTEVSDEEAAQRRITYALFTPETETEAETEANTEGESGSEDAEVPAETASLEENDAAKTQSADETETEMAESEETVALEGESEAISEVAEEAVDVAADDMEAETGDVAADDMEAETEEEVSEEESETETEDPAMVAAKEWASAQAQYLIARIRKGEDFETAANEMGAEFNSITFGKGDESYRAELLEATEGLADGTLVDYPVETDSGYYVVRLDTQLDREATDSEKENIVVQRKADRVNELYEEWESAATITDDSEVLAGIVFDFSLNIQVEPSTEAETEIQTVEDVTEAMADAVETEAGTEEPEAAEMETGTDVTEAAATSETDAETSAEAEETSESGMTEEMSEDGTEALTE